MSSKWMPDILKERAKLIGHAMKTTDIYRWGDYDWHEDLNVRIDKSDFVHYQRSKQLEGRCGFQPRSTSGHQRPQVRRPRQD